MATPSANQYFEAIHTGLGDPVSPNLFTAAELVAGSFSSAAVSSATSTAVSTVNAAAPDSTSISQARSQAVSAASVGSVADSKAISGSVNTSVADSKTQSNSSNISIADSKGVSVANSVPILTVVANSQNVSIADSKAVSVATSVNPLPAAGRTTTTLSGYLANNAVYNVLDFSAGLTINDGVTDATTAVRLAISSLPSSGGTIYFPPGQYKLTDDITTVVNSKIFVRLKGDNGTTTRAITLSDTPAVLYIKSLTKYLYTKSGTGNDVLQLEGLGFDSSDGAGQASAGTTCPGVINSAGLNMFNFSVRDCVFRDFNYSHTNVAANRAVLDLTTVWGSIERCVFGYAQNGRFLYVAQGSTTLNVRRTIFTVARECFYIFNSRQIVFDHCDFESCTTIGACYLSEVTMRNPWFESIGFNNGTAFTTGLAPRAHGLTYGGGTLTGAGGTNGINTPIQMLFGKLTIEHAQIQDFATGGSNYTAAAWFEILGVANAPSTGAHFYMSGLINGNYPLFSTTSGMSSTDRDQDVYIEVHDTWAGASGGTGHGLFVHTGNADYRAVNYGRGNIAFNGGGLRKATLRRGQIHFDIYRGSNDFTAAPGAAVYPLGEQWQIGDRIMLPTPVAAGNIGLVCTTAGTAGAVWKTFGAIQA